jgi:hypothetical protein
VDDGPCGGVFALSSPGVAVPHLKRAGLRITLIIPALIIPVLIIPTLFSLPVLV